MKLYSTVLNEAIYEEIIDKSKFIAYVKPVESRDEAEEYISYIKKQNRDATHNVPAMVIGENMNLQWASDDGEPQGTAGSPIIKMLVALKITNVVVVVTRYFGGIKLGTGGLVRAYTKTAQKALDEANIVDVVLKKKIDFDVDYTYFNKIQSIGQEGLLEILETNYTDKVNVTIAVENESETLKLLNNITAGSININNMENICTKSLRKS